MDAIVIQDVSKQFRKQMVRREYTTFKSELVRWVTRRKENRALARLTALQNISLTIKKGQTFGLVGRNGSGKSTLLKLVTGIYAPTSGSIQVNGRISALLELGAGFHPDFSGRENILINGIILGMTRKEIRARTDEIIEFSELGDFVDQPVRTYSSGMFARLAFSIATHVDPEILIIDEILSVGDEHFGHKSTAKMEEFRKQGKTILLVTHDLSTLERRCDQAAWLDGGVLRAAGNPSEIVARYRQAVAEGEARARGLPVLEAEQALVARAPTSGPAAEAGKRYGTFEMEVSSFRVVDGNGQPQTLFAPDASLAFDIGYVRAKEADRPYLQVTLARDDNTVLWSSATGGPQASTPLTLASEGTLRLSLPRIGLAAGTYRLHVAALGADNRVYDFHRGLYSFTVSGGSTEEGVLRPQHQWHQLPAHGNAAVDAA